MPPKQLWLVNLAVALVALGCGRESRLHARQVPARLDAERDTVIINGPRAVLLPVRLVDTAGVSMPIEAWTLDLRGDSAVQIRGGKLACRGQGDARVSVTVGRLNTSLVVRCRPVAAFGFPPPLELAVGGPPAPVRINALSSTSDSVTLLEFALRVADSSVITIRDGLAYPVAVGRATVVVDLGGISTAVTAQVYEAIANDTLRLSPGEFRSWALAPGRYEIGVAPLASPSDLKWLSMETEGASCARDTQREDWIHCLLRSRGGVGVRNQAPEGSAKLVRALVRVTRIE
jgi:hypothetical protein